MLRELRCRGWGGSRWGTWLQWPGQGRPQRALRARQEQVRRSRGPCGQVGEAGLLGAGGTEEKPEGVWGPAALEVC